MNSTLAARRSLDFSDKLAQLEWYHSMEFPGGQIVPGIIPLQELRERYSEFPFPERLDGKRALDIGTWDGWFAFEMERRGAEVLAIDRVEQENFHFARREHRSSVEYRILDVYDTSPEHIGVFDYVLFLGVLYHLRHPLWALHAVCSVTTEIAMVDSFVVSDGGHVPSPLPWLEFYETEELAGQLDNWFGPTLDCLKALCRSAGFARVEQVGQRHEHATLACHRKWEPPPREFSADAPRLLCATNGSNLGLNFESKHEEFMTCWIETAEDLSKETLRPEVSGFGSVAIALHRDGSGRWKVSFKLPPGLEPGWHEVRVRTANSDFSNTERIAVDVPLRPGVVTIHGTSDSIDWVPGELRFRPDNRSGYLTLWINGLAANCDKHNVRIFLAGVKLPVDHISQDQNGVRQVNVIARRGFIPDGFHTLTVEHGALFATAEILVRNS